MAYVSTHLVEQDRQVRVAVYIARGQTDGGNLIRFLVHTEMKRGLETICLIIDEYSGWGCKAVCGRDAAVELQGRIDRVACNPSRNTTVTTGDNDLGCS